MNAGGAPIVAAPGEVIGVFTGHQQAHAAQYIPGGLPTLFANKR